MHLFGRKGEIVTSCEKDDGKLESFEGNERKKFDQGGGGGKQGGVLFENKAGQKSEGVAGESGAFVECGALGGATLRRIGPRCLIDL